MLTIVNQYLPNNLLELLITTSSHTRQWQLFTLSTVCILWIKKKNCHFFQIIQITIFTCKSHALWTVSPHGFIKYILYKTVYILLLLLYPMCVRVNSCYGRAHAAPPPFGSAPPPPRNQRGQQHVRRGTIPIRPRPFVRSIDRPRTIIAYLKHILHGTDKTARFARTYITYVRTYERASVFRWILNVVPRWLSSELRETKSFRHCEECVYLAKTAETKIIRLVSQGCCARSESDHHKTVNDLSSRNKKKKLILRISRAG